MNTEINLDKDAEIETQNSTWSKPQLLEALAWDKEDFALTHELLHSVSSSNDVDKLREKLERRQAIASLTPFLFLLAGLLSCIGLDALAKTGLISPSKNFTAELELLISAPAVLWLMFYVVSSNACKAKLELLTPISGTDKCQQALRYVERGTASVLAWRDLAIAERGQLYAFDVVAMGVLLDQAKEAVGKDERQRINDEACRRAHGLASA